MGFTKFLRSLFSCFQGEPQRPLVEEPMRLVAFPYAHHTTACGGVAITTSDSSVELATESANNFYLSPGAGATTYIQLLGPHPAAESGADASAPRPAG